MNLVNVRLECLKLAQEKVGSGGVEEVMARAKMFEEYVTKDAVLAGNLEKGQQDDGKDHNQNSKKQTPFFKR